MSIAHIPIDSASLSAKPKSRTCEDITKYGYVYDYDEEEDGPDDEPSFDIGCRYEEYEDEHGETQLRRIPLTRADALHPQEWDEFVTTPAHFDAITDLANSAKHRFHYDPTSCVLSDTNVAMTPGGPDLRPDLIILLNVFNQLDREFGTFYYSEEPAPPRCPLVIEVTSPKTRKNDLDPARKLRIYDDAGVEQYVVVDLPKGKSRPKGQVLNYLRTEHGLEPQPKRPDGRVLLECLDIEVALEKAVIKLFEAESGVDVPTYNQSREQAQAALDTAKEAEKKAKDAEDKAKEAEKKAKDAQDKIQQMEEENRLLKEQLAKLRSAVPTNGSGDPSTPI